MSPIHRKTIGRLIFANVLEMNISKYIEYVDRFLVMTSRAPFYEVSQVDNNILPDRMNDFTGVVVADGDDFHFYSQRNIKLNFQLLHEPMDVKWKHYMNWVRTKNLFLNHVINKILMLQRMFWITNDLQTLVPLSLNNFIEIYSFPHLDIRRLSRLVNNTFISFNGERYLLRNFFPSSKKVHSLILENVVRQKNLRMKDREIQALLKCDYGINVSVRTICNYRNSVHIQPYNVAQINNPYRRFFSDYIPLNQKIKRVLPEKVGVYEISLGHDLKYQKSSSRIIYYGRSSNLRKRIRSYLHSSIKNPVIEYYRDKEKLFLRYFLTSRQTQVEQELLHSFTDISGSLPIANRLLTRKKTIQDQE